MFIKRHRSLLVSLVLMIIISIMGSGCNGGGGIFNPATDTPQPSSTATLTPTPLPTPTATPEPLALRVNGMDVSLAEYEAQLIQIQAADAELGAQHSTNEQRQMAIDELVTQTLMAEAAVQAGYELSESELDSRIAKALTNLGDAAAQAAWLEKNGYTEISFRSAMRRSIQAAWQSEQIMASVPEQAEQVEARQILVRERATADRMLDQLKSGVDFSTLAFQVDPLTGGELGWFPRGYLVQPAVEEAAFALQPGQYSDVIETDIGYHIIQVMERDLSHPLSPDARMALQKKALSAWISERRSASSIEILLP